jgi:hypothetical protein
MTSTPRERARQRFASRCGYCGVSDVEVGATLTIDHHRPRSRGGSDKLRLNRTPLVARRLAARASIARARELDATKERVRELEQSIARMRAAVESTFDEIQRRSGPKGR